MYRNTIKELLKRNSVFDRIAANVLFYLNKYQRREIEKAVNLVKDSTVLKSESELKKDVIYCISKYRMTPQEYVLYKLYEKNEKERAEFVSHSERRKLTHALNKTNNSWKILKDKYQSYLTFKPYYKRDALLINGEKDIDTFLKFAGKYSSFIVKPLDATRGEGIFVVDLVKENLSAEEYFRKNLMSNAYDIEEIISQSAEMAKFHMQSVNTVRVTTWYDKGTVQKVFAVFRMGVGESVVDNAGAGGIIAAVDINTGVVTSPGMREDGKLVCVTHPDTNELILGAQIPKWIELNELIDEVVKVLPDQKWIGWDFALSNNGWVVVEANQSPSFVGIQMCTGKGIREQIEATLGKIEIKQ